MPLVAGTVFAGFTIVRSSGSGGMGEVYLAQHPRLPRRDGLKVLPEGMTADPEFRERFNREADLAATLWHPHIGDIVNTCGRGGSAVSVKRLVVTTNNLSNAKNQPTKTNRVASSTNDVPCSTYHA
jgi:serine/threonine protein kinase